MNLLVICLSCKLEYCATVSSAAADARLCSRNAYYISTFPFRIHSVGQPLVVGFFPFVFLFHISPRLCVCVCLLHFDPGIIFSSVCVCVGSFTLLNALYFVFISFSFSIWQLQIFWLQQLFLLCAASLLDGQKAKQVQLTAFVVVIGTGGQMCSHINCNE